jgi:hypothetical protein
MTCVCYLRLPYHYTEYKMPEQEAGINPRYTSRGERLDKECRKSGGCSINEREHYGLRPGSSANRTVIAPDNEGEVNREKIYQLIDWS